MYTSSCNRRVRAARVCLVGVVAVASFGCVEVSLREGRTPGNYEPFEQPPPPEPTEGAIWRGVASSGSFLFFDQKARGIGDLITVLIVESTQASGNARTDAKSERTLDASLTSDIGLQQLISKPIQALLRMIGVRGSTTTSADGIEMEVAKSTFDNEFKGDGTTSRSNSFTGAVTCRVVNVLPNGLFHVRGRRSVVINHEAELLLLEGLVRREDVGINNTVISTKLAELRLSYDGLGVLDDKQRPGWLGRAFDWIYPL